MSDPAPTRSAPKAPALKAPTPAASPSAVTLAAAGAVALAVAMGIGRFAFTPLLPMMLHDGVVDLAQGSALATANYLGYLAGALLCLGLPRGLPSGAMVRGGLIATVLLTLGMALPLPFLWVPLRFLAGVASAGAFVFTSSFCMGRFAARGVPGLGSLIFAGPGAGIVASGLAAGAMVAHGWTAAAGWAAFALLALIATVPVWPVFSGPDPQPAAPHSTSTGLQPAAARGSGLAMAVFALAYGLAGFGYIVTATFLPVIARTALPGSRLIDLFWPIFGLSAATGSILAARLPLRVDLRLQLAMAYLCQAAGVGLTLILPSALGFALSSLFAGLPFTAITYFALQEVRQRRPHHAARFIGLLTGLYGIGQIAGPPVVGWLLAAAGRVEIGFALGLGLAGSSLVLGAALYLALYALEARPAARR